MLARSTGTNGQGLRGALEGTFDTLAVASLAIVAHFEASSRTPESAAWLGAAEPFDWSRQFFTHAKLDDGCWRVSNTELEDEGVRIQNIVCYPNRVACRIDAKGRPTRRSHLPSLEETVGVPPTCTHRAIV